MCHIIAKGALGVPLFLRPLQKQEQWSRRLSDSEHGTKFVRAWAYVSSEKVRVAGSLTEVAD